jgi:hypothetical protein
MIQNSSTRACCVTVDCASLQDLRHNRVSEMGRLTLLSALERNRSVASVSHKLDVHMLEGARRPIEDRGGVVYPLRIDMRFNASVVETEDHGTEAALAAISAGVIMSAMSLSL